MQEPCEGGWPIGELWFDVIPQFAAVILAGYQAESGIDAVRLFAALAAAWGRHCAPGPASSGAPSQPDVSTALRRRGLLWDWAPEAVPSRPPPRTTPYLAAEPDWPPLHRPEPSPRYTGPPEPPRPSPETVQVRQDMLAFLANGTLLAFGHPDRGGPRQQIEADWWAGPPWRVTVAKPFIWLGTKVGQRPRMWRVLIYRDRSKGHRAHSIPVADRAEGEAGEHGLWRAAAEEAEAEARAPKILAEFCAKLPELPRLIAAWGREWGSFRISRDPKAAAIDELRAPLREHFNQALRAGRWRCFGFSEDRGERVAIRSPWRDGLSFDAAGGMTDERDRRYSDVLFYLVPEAPELTPAIAIEPVAESASGAEKRGAGGRKADPRNKREAMIEGLRKALAAGALTRGMPVTLKAAHKAMLGALGHKVPPAGMGDDAFAKHCKPWLKEHGIYD